MCIFDEYEYAREDIRKENALYLDMFKKELEGKFKITTVARHVGNMDLFLNDFLLYYELGTMQDGAYKLDEFLGDFFIRKCMWSTPGNIKSTAASIKKFYKCMLDHGEIERGDYNFLCGQIKEMMPEWQEACAIYNDPEEENPFYPDWML